MSRLGVTLICIHMIYPEIPGCSLIPWWSKSVRSILSTTFPGIMSIFATMPTKNVIVIPRRSSLALCRWTWSLLPLVRVLSASLRVVIAILTNGWSHCQSIVACKCLHVLHGHCPWLVNCVTYCIHGSHWLIGFPHLGCFPSDTCANEFT